MSNLDIIEYWQKFYVHLGHKLCGLCGNTGIVDTRQTAISPAGIRCGIRTYCICPNGMGLREARDTVQGSKCNHYIPVE